MSPLRRLALVYLAAASAYSLAAAWRGHAGMANDFAAGLRGLVQQADRHLVTPVLNQAREQDAALIDSRDGAFRLSIRPLQPGEARTLPRIDKPVAVPPRMVTAPDEQVSNTDDGVNSITILPDLSPEAAPVPPAPKIPEPKFAEPRMPRTHFPDFEIAREAPRERPQMAQQPPARSQDKVASSATPPVTVAPHMGNRAEAAAMRLKASMSPEMAQNFGLFIFVSKADHGPLAQRMYVFTRESGQLKLLYDWAASTGREQLETSPRGSRGVTSTPAGFYQFDKDRMYRRYHSYNWDQDMPNAMFFNWEREGIQTGLAIHSATGADIDRLGNRASAGCVHLSPENAATLYRLVRDHYEGATPRFAYNRATQTMSNTGALAHDRSGNLKRADGYRVLIDIENYGGGDTLARLF